MNDSAKRKPPVINKAHFWPHMVRICWETIFFLKRTFMFLLSGQSNSETVWTVVVIVSIHGITRKAIETGQPIGRMSFPCVTLLLLLGTHCSEEGGSVSESLRSQCHSGARLLVHQNACIVSQCEQWFEIKKETRRYRSVHRLDPSNAHPSRSNDQRCHFYGLYSSSSCVGSLRTIDQRELSQSTLDPHSGHVEQSFAGLIQWSSRSVTQCWFWHATLCSVDASDASCISIDKYLSRENASTMGLLQSSLAHVVRSRSTRPSDDRRMGRGHLHRPDQTQRWQQSALHHSDRISIQ